MATDSSLTTAVAFRPIHRDADRPLLAVNPGLSAASANNLADVLEHSVRKLLHDSVQDGGLDADGTFLCEFALDAAAALREAGGANR